MKKREGYHRREKRGRKEEFSTWRNRQKLQPSPVSSRDREQGEGFRRIEGGKVTAGGRREGLKIIPRVEGTGRYCSHLIFRHVTETKGGGGWRDYRRIDGGKATAGGRGGLVKVKFPEWGKGGGGGTGRNCSHVLFRHVTESRGAGLQTNRGREGF